jgi:hypothetical protein
MVIVLDRQDSVEVEGEAHTIGASPDAPLAHDDPIKTDIFSGSNPLRDGGNQTPLEYDGAVIRLEGS